MAAPNLKEKIVLVSRSLFMEKGYDAVTMREIAARLGIAVGNLTYHYPRKEDILMALHDQIMSSFESSLSEEWKKEAGLAGYFAREYAFMHFMVDHASFTRMYVQVINSPSMRADYYDRHYKLYQSYVPEAVRSDGSWNGVTSLSSLEFQLMETGALPKDFDNVIAKIFETHILFLSGKPADAEAVIRQGITMGKKLDSTVLLEEPAVRYKNSGFI